MFVLANADASVRSMRRANELESFRLRRTSRANSMILDSPERSRSFFISSFIFSEYLESPSRMQAARVETIKFVRAYV